MNLKEKAEKLIELKKENNCRKFIICAEQHAAEIAEAYLEQKQLLSEIENHAKEHCMDDILYIIQESEDE